jgi:hypothetical protein
VDVVNEFCAAHHAADPVATTTPPDMRILFTGGRSYNQRECIVQRDVARYQWVKTR